MKKIELNDLNKANFAVQEAFKALRTNICFCGDDVKVVAMTSSFANEGKSELALRLAYAFAETGAKTLLLDTDIRSTRLQVRLNASNGDAGLSNVLAKKNAVVSDYIRKTSMNSLDILFAGQEAPNPAELLGKEKFKAILEELKERYEYIIVDCPPLIPVIDAAIVAKECDGTLLVIAQNGIRKSDAKKALDQLKLSGARILGTVLNKVQLESKNYGYGYGGYHKYGKYERYGYGYDYGYGYGYRRKRSKEPEPEETKTKEKKRG